MLVLKNVTKTFGKIKAVEDVTFGINKGDFIFITGPSGAGKTTLVRLILREFLPDSGEILLAGRDITQLSPKQVPFLRQKIGVVFQDFKVLPEKTLRENVEIALAVCGVDQAEWKDRVNDVIKTVGLTKRQRLFPSQLSGGELQRVSLARALVVNPKLILADEPTGNLDWDTASSIMELLQKINKQGKTIIMSTHHKLIVKEHGGRVIEIKDGKLVSDSAPVEIKATPKKDENLKTKKTKKDKMKKNKKVKVEVKKKSEHENSSAEKSEHNGSSAEKSEVQSDK